MKLRILGTLALIALLAGCAATSVRLNFIATEPVNEARPGEGSRAVETRVFQLKSRAAFENAESKAIWDNAEEVLKGDLIKWEPGATVYPSKPGGDARRVESLVENLNQETRFIGVLALMEQSDDQGKRHAVVGVKEAGSVVFRFTGYHVKVE